MSENGDRSERLPYRQLGDDGNPFNRGQPSFDPPEPAEAQDGGRPDGDPTALVGETFVPTASDMDGGADAAQERDSVAPDDGTALPRNERRRDDQHVDDIDDVTELLPGGGRLENPDSDETGLDDTGLGAPLP